VLLRGREGERPRGPLPPAARPRPAPRRARRRPRAREPPVAAQQREAERHEPRAHAGPPSMGGAPPAAAGRMRNHRCTRRRGHRDERARRPQRRSCARPRLRSDGRRVEQTCPGRATAAPVPPAASLRRAGRPPGKTPRVTGRAAQAASAAGRPLVRREHLLALTARRARAPVDDLGDACPARPRRRGAAPRAACTALDEVEQVRRQHHGRRRRGARRDGGLHARMPSGSSR
jgi:hypothetical protein